MRRIGLDIAVMYRIHFRFALKSPENYLGYERTENFASPGGAVSGKRHLYAASPGLNLNHWGLSGD